MRYKPANPSLYTDNRRRLAALLQANSIVIVHSNDITTTNADGTLPLHQSADFFHLTGIDQEESVLLYFPQAHDETLREILFLRETNDHIRVWEGEKLTKEHATQLSGIKTVKWLSEFEKILRPLIIESNRIYLNSNEHPRATVEYDTRDTRFIHRCQREYPLHHYDRLAPLMAQLRSIKQPPEIAQIREAARITGDGFLRILKFLKPNVIEYEIEAELAHEYLRQGSRGFAYTPIIASGKNANCLHYTENNAPCQNGDLLLADVAAEYGNYNADLTRTIPVNGKFSPRQRAVYDAVLRTLRYAISILKPGTTLTHYHQKVGEFVTEELIKLKLLNAKDVSSQDPDKPLYRKYLMHGISHHLGLAVHDVSLTWQPILPGMLFTVEPGLYIPEEGFGIRLENNILILPNGHDDLTAHIPIEADEIETLMHPHHA